MARIALAGLSKTGKTTLVNGLVKLGYIHVNYTDYLKELAVKALNHIDCDVTLEDIRREKELWRPFLIELGHVVGYDDGKYVTEVLNRARPVIEGTGPDNYVLGQLTKDIVFDQVKQPAQWRILKRYGFKLIRLEANDVTRGIRGMRVADMPPMPYQPGEITINTDGYTPDEVLDLVLGYTETAAA